MRKFIAILMLSIVFNLCCVSQTELVNMMETPQAVDQVLNNTQRGKNYRLVVILDDVIVVEVDGVIVYFEKKKK